MPKNILIIVADTLRHPAFLFGNSFKSALPGLASMTGAGVSFTNLLASSSWTLPSHASLMTGVEPWSVHYDVEKNSYLAPDVWSLASDVRERGGESLVASQNFFLNPRLGLAMDFDYAYFPGLFSAVSQRSGKIFDWTVRSRFGRRTIDGSTESHLQGKLAARLSRPPPFLLYCYHRAYAASNDGYKIVQKVSKFLRHRGENPYHVIINLMDMHEPYIEPHYSGKPFQETGYVLTRHLSSRTIALNEAPQASHAVSKVYTEALSHLDERITCIFGMLKLRGALEDTLVLFVSDHGQALGEEGFFGHGYKLQDELVKIPGVMWWFKDQEPQLLSNTVDVPLDHRHLHYIMHESLRRTEFDIDNLVHDAVRAKGDAYSFFEGFHPSHGGHYRALRVEPSRNRHVVCYKSDSATSPGPSNDIAEDDWDYATQRMDQIISAQESGRYGNSTHTSVISRLETWGYV